jgi:hypothetical protein
VWPSEYACTGTRNAAVAHCCTRSGKFVATVGNARSGSHHTVGRDTEHGAAKQ